MAACWRITVTGCPTLSLPAGFDADGMPVGVQLVTRQGADVALLRAAKALEEATGFAARAAAAGARRDDTALRPRRRSTAPRRRSSTRPATWTFATIDDDAVHLAGALPVAHGDRVAILCTAGHDIVTAVLACWHAGAVAVPLHPPNPDAELAYVLADSGAAAIIASPAHRDAADRLAATAGIPVVDVAASGLVHRFSPGLDRPALMIYTSGTTGRPKGAVHTHGSIAAMVDGMVAAWAWSAADRTVLVLPLNHVHGLVNVTLTPLAVGACCEAPGSFDAVAVWERLASGEVTVFMAVPTIYARLTAGVGGRRRRRPRRGGPTARPGCG